MVKFDCNVSVTERAAVEWLAAIGKYTEATVKRRSEREFDLGIEGEYEYTSEEREPSIRLDDGTRPGYRHVQLGKPTGRMETRTMRFGAWFPLACLKVWWGHPKWGRYVDDCGTGDWSFVRDAEPGTIWGMFHSIVNAARNLPSQPVRNHTAGVRLYIH